MMEVSSTSFYGGLKRYWRRRRYQRLTGANTSKKNVKIVRFGGNTRRSWKIRVIPKLRLKIVSPIKILARLKEAYVDMMVSMAGNVGYLNNVNFFGGKRVPKARQIKEARSSSNDFEMRLAVEIYKSLVANRELAAF